MDWDFKDLLAKEQIDPRTVLVLRHTPKRAPRLRELLPWLAADHPALYNAYQQTQSRKVEKRMKAATYVASFIGHAPASALFVGLYKRHGQKARNTEEIRSEPSVKELESFGHHIKKRKHLWFDLRLREEFFGQWKGKLVIEWPGKEINWHPLCRSGRF